MPVLTGVRHYAGQGGVFGRIGRLLGAFEFGSIGGALEADTQAASPLNLEFDRTAIR